MARQKLYQRIEGKTGLLIIMIMSAGIILVSCSTSTPITRMYSGPALTEDQVAILMQSKNGGAHIVSVDGKSDLRRSSWDRSAKLELLPGLHTVEVSYTRHYYGEYRTVYSRDDLPIRFYAKSGHTYYLYGIHFENSNSWFPVIRDATGEIVKPNLPLDAEVISVLFYEEGPGSFPYGQRVYRQRFPKSEARYIMWELRIKHPAPGHRIYFNIDHLWCTHKHGICASDSKRRRSINCYIEGDQTSTWYADGTGWDKAGHWEIGSHDVTFYVEGKEIASGSFEIY
jgi:hypothetical protein